MSKMTQAQLWETLSSASVRGTTSPSGPESMEDGGSSGDGIASPARLTRSEDLPDSQGTFRLEVLMASYESHVLRIVSFGSSLWAR